MNILFQNVYCMYNLQLYKIKDPIRKYKQKYYVISYEITGR